MSLVAICLSAAGLTISLSAQVTLAWTHSIEKIRWEEDYRIRDGQLYLTEARIRGSGAGMEPPEGAVLREGVWHYQPSLPALPQVRLTRSGHVPDYEVCEEGRCRMLGDLLGAAATADVVTLQACRH